MPSQNLLPKFFARKCQMSSTFASCHKPFLVVKRQMLSTFETCRSDQPSGASAGASHRAGHPGVRGDQRAVRCGGGARPSRAFRGARQA